MQVEILYQQYVQGTQAKCSIQGYPLNGLMIMTTKEELEPDTFLTVRTPTSTLVERIPLSMLHQISDFTGGNGTDGTFTGYTYVDFGLISLGDNEELICLFDCEGDPVSTQYLGVAALVDDLPEHDEIIYHYQHHTDSSFASDAAAAVYLFKSSITASADLINVKMGDDTRSTTLRSTNWFANLMGKIELGNTTMGVLFENKYGQPITVNTASTGLTTIVKRIVQVDSKRQVEATKRLANAVVRKVDKLDAQTLRAIP